MRPATDQLEHPNTLLDVRDLHTQFVHPRGTVRAVDGVSLRVDQGEAVAIIGESGSGKTSIALSILRLVPGPRGRIVRGRIRLRGRDLLRRSEAAVRRARGREVAYLPPEPAAALDPHRSIQHHLVEAIARVGGIADSPAVDRRAKALLLEVGMEPGRALLGARPGALSPVSCQRVLIALALAGDPALVIADEPAGSLDGIEGAGIVDLLARLRRRHRHAQLLLSRDPGLAAAMADRVAVLYAGRVVEAAPAPHLFTLPRHPYTQLLLRARLRVDRAALDALEPIPGQPPDRHQIPPGCPFEPRCPLAHEPCASAYPPEVRVAGQHVAACWLLEE